jgi:hypothetical protein
VFSITPCQALAGTVVAEERDVANGREGVRQADPLQQRRHLRLVAAVEIGSKT